MLTGGKSDHCQKNENSIYLLNYTNGKEERQQKNIYNFKEIIAFISLYVAGELYSIPSQTSKTGVTVE